MSLSPRPWALVCDPGIDDAVALAVLVGLGAAPDLVVSEPGNVSGAVAARNAAAMVALLGRDVPVRAFRGTHPATVRPGRGSRHGDDGLGGVAHRLPRTAMPEPLAAGELPSSVLVTGSLACAGEAVAAHRTFDRIVWMGGSLGHGNITATAEFNAWTAPEDADLVLTQCAPVVRVVPLEATTQIVIDDEDLAAWARGGATARLLAEAMQVRRSQGGAYVHDAVAAVAWLRPELFGWEGHALRCETVGEHRGALVTEGPGPTEVAVRVEAAALRSLIVDAILACP